MCDGFVGLWPEYAAESLCFFLTRSEGARDLYGDVCVWQIDREGNYRHPTQKPVALISRALRNSTIRGESVLDPFVGSGTTMIACEQLGRLCFAMEIEPKYCDVVVERWETYTGKKAELVREQTEPAEVMRSSDAAPA